MRYAVIDMGTNTFHLLIVDKSSDGSWKTVVRHRIFVKMAEDGIRRIGKKAYKRGLDALKMFKTQIDAAGVGREKVIAQGTAALRSALNAPDFIRDAEALVGFPLRVISGEREAELIYKGVRSAVPFPEATVLIMDIGGGSVEFILANREKVFWQKSLDIGVSILNNHFHKGDPIQAEEILALEDFLDLALKELWETLEKQPTKVLIGAAGAFDIIDEHLLYAGAKPTNYGWLKYDTFVPFCEKMIQSTSQERKKILHLQPERAEMVVVAFLLIRYVCQKSSITELYTSEYSLKEGVLTEIV